MKTSVSLTESDITTVYVKPEPKKSNVRSRPQSGIFGEKQSKQNQNWYFYVDSTIDIWLLNEQLQTTNF